MGGRLHPEHADRGRQALASRPSSRSSTTTRTSTSRSAPTTIPRRSIATRAGATTSRVRGTSSASASTATTTSAPASSSTSRRAAARSTSSSATARRSGTRRWDAVWDGEVAHDDKGWTAEFRVPLNQLRYGPQEEQVWGTPRLALDRPQPGRGPVAAHPAPEHRAHVPARRAARASTACKRSRHVELLPTSLGKAAPDPVGPGRGHRRRRARVGLDAKIGLTSNFTLDATVNPDFGQVEADPSVINLTAYETFYEEKRPFFLEGRKILAFGVEGERPALLLAAHRRGALLRAAAGARARRSESPESTTILGALKVTGKTTDGLSVGVLQSLHPEGDGEHRGRPRAVVTQSVEPFGSYTVGRVHKDWGKGHTSLGGMITSTHRWISDPALAFLPTPGARPAGSTSRATSPTGRGSSRRAASSATSRATARRSCALQTNPVHYYQRPDASYLGVDRERHVALRLRRLRPVRHYGQGPPSAHRPLPPVLARARLERRRATFARPT